MTQEKQPESICERHREFVPLIAAINRVEGEIEESSPLLLRTETGTLHETLAHELIPHAVGEGRTVFPVLRRVTGTDKVTKEMLHEHREISRLTDELERIRQELTKAGIGTAQEAQMRKVLSDLRAAVQHHFDQEEQACFEVLKTELTPEEAEELYAAMEKATKEIRRSYGCGGGASYQ
jgi:iron-sulfur cluster repair protein YtfE (RIC family)